MSHTLTISDQLYKRLKSAAAHHGLNSIEQFLELLEEPLQKKEPRRESVKRIRQVHTQLASVYGELPDSTELIRSDRNG